MGSTAAAWACAVLALMSLAVFVWLQFASIDNGDNKPDFLFLVFSSFFFLGIATILAFIVWRGPTIGQKALAVAVSTILIIGTIFVANSLTQNRRGGLNASTYVTVGDFVLNMQGYKSFDQVGYRRQYSKVIHEPSYAASEIWLSTRKGMEASYLEITLLTPANVNGTCYIIFHLEPYERNAYGALVRQEVVFTENSTSQVFDVDVNPIWSGGYRGKFEEYNIEFMLDLDLSGAEMEPSVLNFTVTSHIGVDIHEWIVISTFQNNLCFALCGVFIGTNILVPGTFPFYLLSRMRKKKEVDKEE